MPTWLMNVIARTRWYVWLGVAIFAVGVSCGGCVCQRWHDMFGTGPAGSFGWRDDPQRVRAVLATLPRPLFADAGAALIAKDDNADALLYLACQRATGANLSAHNQEDVGCCVGEGFSSAVEYLQCVNLALRSDPVEYRTISHSAIYALARELGGYLGTSDGATGADAAKALHEIGALSCTEAGETNETSGHARLWGRIGLPKPLRGKASQHPVRTASLVTSAAEVRAALRNGYPVAICSDVGFDDGRGHAARRDADGFIASRGRWMHCMCAIGYRADRRGFCLLQSWGPNVPGGPTVLGQPDCSFWISWETMDRMARQGDSWAISNFEGFPARTVDFYVRHSNHDRTIATSTH